MKSDAFGDRMKGYEDRGRFEPCLPIIVRIDGKSFHTYTRDFDRPYDKWMSGAMRATTKFLVEQTCARIGFTQSDEITLILHSDDPKSQVFFDGKVQKIVSVSAAMASVRFNQLMSRRGNRAELSAYFDSRAYTVPDRGEASNVLLWREMDAVRNSVSMMAHHHFGHSALKKKSVPEMKDMLASIGEPWEDAPASFTHGTHYIRREVERPFTDDDLARIPEKFHPPVGALVKRQVVQRVEGMPKRYRGAGRCDFRGRSGRSWWRMVDGAEMIPFDVFHRENRDALIVLAAREDLIFAGHAYRGSGGDFFVASEPNPTGVRKYTVFQLLDGTVNEVQAYVEIARDPARKIAQHLAAGKMFIGHRCLVQGKVRFTRDQAVERLSQVPELKSMYLCDGCGDWHLTRLERVDEMPKGIGEQVALIFGETSEDNWLKQEFRRASERSAQVPPHAKPVRVNP